MQSPSTVDSPLGTQQPVTRPGWLRRSIQCAGLLLLIAPIIGLLVLVYGASVGGAPGMILGMLILPALAASGFGCLLFVVASIRRLRAFLVVPICLALYIATVPLAQRLAHYAHNTYFYANVELLRGKAVGVLAGEATLEGINRDLKRRKMPIYAVTDNGDEPNVVAFVFGGTLGHYAGFAFSVDGERPKELNRSFVQLWRPHESDVYYFATGDYPEAEG